MIIFRQLTTRRLIAAAIFCTALQLLMRPVAPSGCSNHIFVAPPAGCTATDQPTVAAPIASSL